MISGRFMPNSPTLMNAGKKHGQLSACYVLPIDDTLDSIFDTMKNAAKIHQSGGGTGFSFSRIRPAGSAVRTTNGVASGPVSFLKIYDKATETIKQGGTRRGANMGILRVDHPDIFEFIDVKKSGQEVQNFNLSVAITDKFMASLRKKDLAAVKIFDHIIHAAWSSGDPGLIFIDRINKFNPTPQVGKMESTNPCGEQPLLPYESCNLGSLNLSRYLQGGQIAWETFRQDIWTAVRFLDNVIDLNHFPLEECKEITLKNRKIGLGVMGFADLLLAMQIPYDTDEARKIGEQIMKFLDDEAKKASQDLAKKKGKFPNWKGSRWQKLKYAPMRNATVSTVAPTGTISIIVGASSGIEPIFSATFYRNVLDGERLLETHPAAESAKEGVWSPASQVSIEGHVKMQAVFQRHSDSAVSKTVNLPREATPEDVGRAYMLAYDLGCKGITVYRDQSRPTQVLEHHMACKVCE
jgi:ribonucleoside-diphosphate reductase alpha chain